MKGPTICRLTDGKARRTCISPRSTARGTISISIASALARSPGTGSGQGLQLICCPPLKQSGGYRASRDRAKMVIQWLALVSLRRADGFDADLLRQPGFDRREVWRGLHPVMARVRKVDGDLRLDVPRAGRHDDNA